MTNLKLSMKFFRLCAAVFFAVGPFCLSNVLGLDCSTIGGMCYSNPCSCSEVTNCACCNEGAGCDQCMDGYFVYQSNYQCVSCFELFGNTCLFCQNDIGCGQCIDGYARVYDGICGLWHCIADDYVTEDGQDDPISEDYQHFGEGLTAAINMYGLDSSYYGDYMSYALIFEKLTDYSVDGSDNYEEIKMRYECFILNDVFVKDANDEILDAIENNDGIIEDDDGEEYNITDALEAANWTIGDDVYEHSQFSDWTDEELLSALDESVSEEDDDDTSTTFRRRLQILTFVAGSSLVYNEGFTDLRSYAADVQDERPCHSSFAFATTAQFEINYNIFEENDDPDCLVKFSEQYTLDCANAGDCNTRTGGGIIADRYYENSGHCTESQYGVFEGEKNTCQGCGDEDYHTHSSDTKIIVPFLDFVGAAKQVSQHSAVQFRINIRRSYFFTRFVYFGFRGSFIGSRLVTGVGQRSDRFLPFNRFGTPSHPALLIRESFGTRFANGGYYWLPYSSAIANRARFFVWSEFENGDPDVRHNIPTPLCPANLVDTGICPASCGEYPCDCYNGNNPHCAICHGRAGCEKCESGYFHINRGFPCMNCNEVFGDKCLRCNIRVGCAECENGYYLQVDENCGLQKCVKDCRRHRKPWHLLTDDERMVYINGFLAVQNSVDGFRITELSKAHEENFGQAHIVAKLFPWHRYYLWELETQIRNLPGDEYECFGLPYWDWGHESHHTVASQIYSSGLSGPGGGGGPSCVTGTFFDNTRYRTPTDCLRRNSWSANEMMASGMFRQTAALMDIIVNPANDLYASFAPAIAGGPHGSPHGAVGGNMITERSSDDPLFFLHHNYIDFLWAVWQDCHDYDLIDKDSITNDIYSDDPDEVMEYNGLYGFNWIAVNDYNPTARDMHDITDWDVVYDIGDFWQDGDVTGSEYCGNNMNDAWFIDGTDSRRRARRLQEAEENTCDLYLRECTSGNNACQCNEIDYETCEFCNDPNTGCSQCSSGYFKASNNHQCIGCLETFGVGCLFCQNGIGCGQCDQGYSLVYDEACGVSKCVSNVPVPSPSPTQAPLSQFLDTTRTEIFSRSDLNDQEKREMVSKVVCEYSTQNAIRNGFISEACVIPDDFEDCSNIEEDLTFEITLDYLLNKGGVRDSQCLQLIRVVMFDWLQLTGFLLELCNGEFDPAC